VQSVFANVRLANDHAFFLERFPRGIIGVVIERGEQDFVAGVQLAGDGAGERVGDGGHVLAEDHFVFFAVEEVGHGRAGVADDFFGCGGWLRKRRRYLRSK